MSSKSNNIKSAIEHLNMLVQLASADGNMDAKEIELIKKIGKANGLSLEQIKDSFNDPSNLPDLEELSLDEKYDYIYNIVQLMKIDGKVYKEELLYCIRIASRLGYKVAGMKELIFKIYSNPNITKDKETLKKTVQKYLK